MTAFAHDPPTTQPHEPYTAFGPDGRLSLQPGSYCWLEIPVLDLDRAKSFYGKLFGWDFAPPSAMGLPDEGTYLIFSKKGTAAHGGLQLVKPDLLVAPKEKGHWAVRITITVESVDATLAEAEKAGGGIVETKTSIGSNMGDKGALRDTEGNTIGVFESAPAPGRA